MKRIYRNDMPQTQRDKIAMANTGRHHSTQTRERIAQSMREYWDGLPYKPDTDTNGTTSDNNPYRDS